MGQGLDRIQHSVWLIISAQKTQATVSVIIETVCSAVGGVEEEQKTGVAPDSWALPLHALLHYLILSLAQTYRRVPERG